MLGRGQQVVPLDFRSGPNPNLSSLCFRLVRLEIEANGSNAHPKFKKQIHDLVG